MRHRTMKEVYTAADLIADAKVNSFKEGKGLDERSFEELIVALPGSLEETLQLFMNCINYELVKKTDIGVGMRALALIADSLNYHLALIEAEEE